MKKFLFWGILMLSGAAIFFFSFQSNEPAKETITFFPLDDSVRYKNADTTLTLEKEKKDGQHRVDWKVHSTLDRKAFLRQDLGLLYVNGRLKGALGRWKQNTADLKQEKVISTGESAKYNAISFHYSEIHGNGEKITSSQNLSEDMLYVIDSPYSPLRSFRNPKSKLEKEWTQALDQASANTIKMSLEKAIRTFGIKTGNYFSFPLSEIRKYEDQPFPGFTQKETAIILGKLWEGIYKNYYLGIKKSNGTVIDPINSTMPTIFISKDKTHLLVLTEAKDGESIILLQKIQ